MTTVKSCNCIVCAQEFSEDELQSVALSEINVTRFKICNACFEQCDPAENYRQARDIIKGYLWFAEARSSFKEASDILDEVASKKK